MSEWQELVDPNSGNKYYYNESTGVTQWERPEELGPDTTEVEAQDSDDLANWASAIDPSSGNTYYFNSVTGVTQWEAPPGWVDTNAEAEEETVDASQQPEDEHSPSTGAEPAGSPTNDTMPRRRTTVARRRMSVMHRHAIQRKQSGKPQTVSEKLAARSRKFIQMRKAEKSGSKAAAFASNPAIQTSIKASADGNETAGDAGNGGVWQSAVDPDSGQTYYFNPATGETTWELPTGN